MEDSKEFSAVDIVVCEGIICRYGAIKPLVDKNDIIRLANEKEIKLYFKTKNRKNGLEK